MRWDQRQLTAVDGAALPGLGRLAGLVRSVRTPEFEGVTFHEVLCRSALNQVPAASAVPFRWTINPYRGCSHACVYCFARGTHRYLDLDPGRDFDQQVVVKINVAEVARRELARPSWAREHVAMGTNTDPYQRAEGRYRLMPEIIAALAESDTPFSILTKGTLLRRDLALLRETARTVDVRISVSLGVLDERLHRTVEPGTPTPRARLDLITAIRDAGFGCHVLAAPILPGLTDDPSQLDRLVGTLAEAGATGVTAIPLHLRPGAREWYSQWLADEHPELVQLYRRLYGDGSYADREYQRRIRERVVSAARARGLAPAEGRGGHRRAGENATSTPPAVPPARTVDQGALF